ncbi:MAG: isoprenyl transferase [Deltaproteobacteria bacterium]|nr:isoprenyl transferase [Candidatus Anaeroferrophillacea bacterium]
MSDAAMTDLPRHVAIIMDGNGRWATSRGLGRVRGHEAGIRTVEQVVEHCARRGIGVLTLYAFSSENWQRPPAEVGALMHLLRVFLRRETARLRRNDIRLRAIGRRERLEPVVREELEEACRRTADCSGMVLNLAISYGSRDELTTAVRRLAREVRAGTLDPDAIDEECLTAALDTRGLPDPDLLIRTGGEYRVSNFLLWQAAYAELAFTATLWPDFTTAELDGILADYGRRERRFGKTSEQVAS